MYQAIVNGVVKYIGITNDFSRRAAEQFATKGINIREIPGLVNISRPDARAVEQILIERNGLQSQGGNLLNKINSISPNNLIYEDSIKKGQEILQKLGL